MQARVAQGPAWSRGRFARRHRGHGEGARRRRRFLPMARGGVPMAHQRASQRRAGAGRNHAHGPAVGNRASDRGAAGRGLLGSSNSYCTPRKLRRRWARSRAPDWRPTIPSRTEDAPTASSQRLRTTGWHRGDSRVPFAPWQRRRRHPRRRPWPEPRVLEQQVEEIYRHAPTATAFSYFGALLVLGSCPDRDMGRGSAWFLWATIVVCIRVFVIMAYRRRAKGLIRLPGGGSSSRATSSRASSGERSARCSGSRSRSTGSSSR
jgi:hypothetical protein